MQLARRVNGELFTLRLPKMLGIMPKDNLGSSAQAYFFFLYIYIMYIYLMSLLRDPGIIGTLGAFTNIIIIYIQICEKSFTQTIIILHTLSKTRNQCGIFTTAVWAYNRELCIVYRQT